MINELGPYMVAGSSLVSQARPNQPQHGSLSVSRSPCVILKAIRAGVGWVWLARLVVAIQVKIS